MLREGVRVMLASMTVDQQLSLVRTLCAAVSAVCAMTTLMVVVLR